jgi:alpha-galactosidase
MNLIDIHRPPDHVGVMLDGREQAMRPADAEGRWEHETVVVEARPGERGLTIAIRSSRQPVERIHCRWRMRLDGVRRVLGDHWERGYGDLEWRGMVPQRMLPWYFLAFDGERTHGAGVRTGAASIASWRIDPEGVSLWLDVRCGGVGVQLEERELEAATVVTRAGREDETPFKAAREFCRKMCDGWRAMPFVVYGSNNWYYAYGNSSRQAILDDARLVRDLSPDPDNWPCMVIDDGWQAAHDPPFNGGPWDAGNERFGDMGSLAVAMRDREVRPGIWFRPLWTKQPVFRSWHFAANRFRSGQSPPPLDPSVSDVLDFIATDIRRMVEWGYTVIKHDFTTFDLCGRWGFKMGCEMAPDGWCFSNRTRTTAEIVRHLYHRIREAAGEAVIIGCNTIGHLAAGLFELQRTGDDTSGQHWERTRKMGVNTLAFRMPQHGTFFAADADCVGLTRDVPWELNRQWLDLLARSGTPLFVSAAPDAMGPPQADALRKAFAAAARKQPAAEPLDWLDTTAPSRWRIAGEEVVYHWYPNAGMPLRTS